jgi:hypothetical protein
MAQATHNSKNSKLGKGSSSLLVTSINRERQKVQLAVPTAVEQQQLQSATVSQASMLLQ